MAAANIEADEHPPATSSGGGSIFAWCLYDWAMSAYNTVIGTFIFSVYFQRGIYGDEAAGAAAWAYAGAGAGLLVALLSPALGAVADRLGRRKPWIAVFTVATVVPTAFLWFATPDPGSIAFALTLVVLSTIAFEFATVFYNAMLPSVSPPAMMGRVSGWAWGLGYIGGLGCLAACLFLFVGVGDGLQPLIPLPREQSEPVRATALVVAGWYFLFSIPLFVFTVDQPASGERVAEAVSRGLRDLKRTLLSLPRHGNMVRFLIASALYRDGLSTLFAVGGLYAAGAFGMSFGQILVFAIGLNVTGGLGAAGFGFLDDRAGSRTTVLISILGLIAFAGPLLLISDITTFIVLSLGLGLFVGPTQAASRTLLARLTPRGIETEMFGLYALTGKSISPVGPAVFGLATELAGLRVGMATILVFWLAGGLLLLTVREAREAEMPSPSDRV